MSETRANRILIWRSRQPPPSYYMRTILITKTILIIWDNALSILPLIVTTVSVLSYLCVCDSWVSSCYTTVQVFKLDPIRLAGEDRRILHFAAYRRNSHCPCRASLVCVCVVPECGMFSKISIIGHTTTIILERQ